MQYSEMGLRIQRRLDVKPPCYLAGPSGPAFFIFHIYRSDGSVDESVGTS